MCVVDWNARQRGKGRERAAADKSGEQRNPHERQSKTTKSIAEHDRYY
jgi:hypothetical protein